ncbi:18433_t:CDS:10 [Acaulospora morrowiae]|uniref:18433_t:CDS:1 n=1 Tax=Acaulospora morrowiae TaxID=94023 RepID=A0A9N9FMV6_9GLOM|nr:18433_t:CDS:10 [Acaulospora morrowiae]
MDNERPLIELLEELSDSQNRCRSAFLERCLKASSSELEEFFNELSQSLNNSCDDYLAKLQTFASYLYDEYSRTIRRLNLTPDFINFISMLITYVIIENLGHSDNQKFVKFLDDCVELLWRAQNDRLIDSTNNKGNNLLLQAMSRLFNAILDADGVFGVLVSETPGRHCIKRVLFGFNMITQVEQEKLLRAEDTIAFLVEKCFKHGEVSSRIKEDLVTYKACTDLLETLKRLQSAEIDLRSRRSSLPPDLHEMVELENRKEEKQYQNRKRSVSNSAIDFNSVILSGQNKKSLELLRIKAPQKPSELHNFSLTLKQRKMDSFKGLIEFFPCASCHRRALKNFHPEKYSSLEEKESSAPQHIFRLPFEFDENDRLGPWDILLSEDAIKDMGKLESPIKIKVVMKKLGQISSGEWVKHGLRHKVSSSDIPVYEVKLPEYDLTILWQVDYGFSIRSYSDMQLVKIWAVTANQEQIHTTLENLAMVHQVYTDKHNRYCSIPESECDIILPTYFECEGETKSTDEELFGPKMDDERLLEVHRMLVTNKFIPLSKNLFKSLVFGSSDFTFQVSKVEYEIINNPRSAIIVGRSGTGKTTCIVFRQIASYLTNKLDKKQIFITVSYNLCRRVKEYFHRLRESAVLAGKKMSIAEFNEELSDIPNSFHLLKDHHFPLFITYDKFSEMLQGTYGIDIQKLTTQQKEIEDDDIYTSEDDEEKFPLINVSDASWAHFVDYNLFEKKYWPHFNYCYRKKLNCELVYSEFSIIKGTNPEVDCLSRDDYRTISYKKYPAFCNNRDEIYDLFERYEKMKARNGDYDSADRTLAILRAAKKCTLGGPYVHELYIDECQDNQILDFSLILKLFDKAESIIMAGDIAQCIARGSSFRFQDLRALMYKWELDHHMYSSIKSKMFELNTNYRSHNGIIQLASSVIDLIKRFFPDSIDHLSRERGEVGGPRPIFFAEIEAKTFLFNVFCAGDPTANCVEFGADQVIIVRNDETKKHVRNLNENAGLVLTVFEAKGMEFNDVLLYNFFTESPACSKWRTILSDLENSTETLYDEKPYILSSELKHLYVALTRARERLWIFDENSEWSRPILTYWMHHGLVRVVSSIKEINTLPTLAKKSSSQEWNRQGKKFFERRQYELAITCFEKSGNEKRKKLASAYLLQQNARNSVNDSDEATVKSNFKLAAQAFNECSRPIQEASCYQDIKMYKEAGDVYKNWDMFELAARSYIKGNKWHEAGDCFAKAKMYNEATVSYKDGKLYEIAVNFMERHKPNIDEKIFRRIIRLIYVCCRKDNKDLSEKALSMLTKQEDRIEILKDHAPEEVQEVYKREGQFRDAAEELCSRGKFEEASDVYIRSSENEDIIKSLQCLLHLCRTNILKNTIGDTMNPKAREELQNIVSKAINLTTSRSVKSESWIILVEETQLYLSYLNENFDAVRKGIMAFKKYREPVAEFRAISMWLTIPAPSDVNVDYWYERLQFLQRLCELIIPSNASPRNAKDVEKIKKSFEKICLVKRVTSRPNQRKISFDNPLLALLGDNFVEMDYWHVFDVNVVHKEVSKLIGTYIYELILKTNRDGREISEITSEICECQNPRSCRRYHVTLNPSIIKKRLKLACLQYTVMRQLSTLEFHRLLNEDQNKEVFGPQRFWAEKLVKLHFRYQSPHTSCPEITYMVINELPNFTYNGLIGLTYKRWLNDKEFEVDNFAKMLKFIFFSIQLRNIWGIEKFNWKVSEIRPYSENYLIGFGYDPKYHEYRAIGRRLSLFLLYLDSDELIPAINHAKAFIYYAISNLESVKIMPDGTASEPFKPKARNSLGDLISLMEFTVSCIFSARPFHFDFLLPRSYLVNYFYSFKETPLLPHQYYFKKEQYGKSIYDLFYQTRELLDILISKNFFYSPIILRLIRILVLIGLNDYRLANKVTNYFILIFPSVPGRFRTYLQENTMSRLAGVLNNDLKGTGCDSLLIVYYNLGGKSRFEDWKKFGIEKLTYKSIEEFRSSLRNLMVPEASGEKTASAIPQSTKGNEQNSAQDAANRIQVWFRQIAEREKYRKSHGDQILDKIYYEAMEFSQVLVKEHGKSSALKYVIYLRGLTVDIIETCLDLRDELRITHNDNVEEMLNSLSITESKKHKEMNIEWLKKELERASGTTIVQVSEWISKCDEL